MLVILRGGMDGLAAVPPYGESSYERTREGLALAAPGEAGGVLKLDGTQSVPMVLRGDVPVESWAPSPLPSLDPDTLARLLDLYRDDAFFAARLRQALATDEMAERALRATPGRGRRAGRVAFAALARAAAAFLSAPDGPRIAVLEFGGWDTHANQGAGQGRLATQLASLDSGVTKLRQGLGPAWSRTAVIVVSEFGRTVGENGTRGTDHGTAGAAFLLGGAVRGGRVVSDWPGIRKRALYEGRDLMPTLDARSLFKGVLRDHLGVPPGALEQHVFPSSAAAAPLDQLIVTPAARERSV